MVELMGTDDSALPLNGVAMKPRMLTSIICTVVINCSPIPQVEGLISAKNDGGDAGVVDGSVAYRGEWAGSQMPGQHNGETCPNVASLHVGDLITSVDAINFYVGAKTLAGDAGWECQRHAFADGRTFLSWFADYDGVQNVSESVLDALRQGVNTTYRPGSRLLALDVDDFAVYVIARGKTLHRVTTSEAERLYGSEWYSQADSLPEIFRQDYIMGPDLNCPKSRDGPNCTGFYNPDAEVTLSDINYEITVTP